MAEIITRYTSLAALASDIDGPIKLSEASMVQSHCIKKEFKHFKHHCTTGARYRLVQPHHVVCSTGAIASRSHDARHVEASLASTEANPNLE